ncbi:hypothetical protein P8452_15042 [Trifolium repens]|nr:hypothetical protein P8452_15042 [Trifolium repens]
MKDFNDWEERFEERISLEQREMEALDSCISSELGKNVRHRNSDYYHEVNRLFEALSEKEKEDQREVWRKKIYKKFALRDDWAQLGLTFWDKNYSMMEAAKVVHMKKMADDAKATPLATSLDAEVTLPDAEATPSKRQKLL